MESASLCAARFARSGERRAVNNRAQYPFIWRPRSFQAPARAALLGGRQRLQQRAASVHRGRPAQEAALSRQRMANGAVAIVGSTGMGRVDALRRMPRSKSTKCRRIAATRALLLGTISSAKPKRRLSARNCSGAILNVSSCRHGWKNLRGASNAAASSGPSGTAITKRQRGDSNPCVQSTMDF